MHQEGFLLYVLNNLLTGFRAAVLMLPAHIQAGFKRMANMPSSKY